MDLNSPEFYTIAFVVAMAIVALLMGHREKQPPSTHIIQLITTPEASTEQSECSESGSPQNLQNNQLLSESMLADDVLCMEPMESGRIHLSRTGLTLGAEETINLVITIQENHCTIVEKKGLKRRRAVGEPVTGEATLKCLRPGRKYRIRYESQITSAWASFTFDTTSPSPVTVSLKY